MKIQGLFYVAILLGFCPFAIGQVITPREPRWKQLCQAYGFVLGQQTSLEMIERRFPDLAKEARRSLVSFNSTALGESAKGLESELSRMFGDKWPKMRAKMGTDLPAEIDEKLIKKEDAKMFFDEVISRGKGDLPDQIGMTLLSAHPRYIDDPHLEMTEGWKRTFRTKGHAKSKGVDFSISIPFSWSKREGERPNIIQFFQSGAGYGPIMCSLIVGRAPSPTPTKEEWKEMFQPEGLKHMIPSGAMFIEAKSLVLEGSPAGVIVFDDTARRLDTELRMRRTQFITVQGESLIYIQFLASQMAGVTESLDELQKKNLPLYFAIVNSFVFNDRYRND